VRHVVPKFIIGGLVIAAMAMSAAFAAETPRARAFGGIPKGSYSGSCTCALSGGIYLTCYCNNLQSKMFQTNMDLRTCLGPKDIKNCNGTLTCTESASASCPESH